MSRRARWKIADLIDFEYLLAGDVGREDERVALGMQDQRSRPAVFRAWLETRRTADGGAWPGAQFAAGWQTLLMFSALVGLALGGGVTGALLHYRGEEPVNVSWFLACTVGVQMLVLAAALGLWLLRATTRIFDEFHPLRWLLSSLVRGFSAGVRRLPGAQRERVRAAFAVISGRREVYGDLAVWPLLIVTQFFGVCFNLGILAVLLAHVAATDLAFGWQSTLRASPAEVYRLVAWIAAPWSWFAPHAHPTFDQVVASRFQYSAGMGPLPAQALAAWWPFLCYAVAFYGLLVRTVLLVLAWVKLRAGLGALTFDHQGCHALFRRLTGPIIQAQPDAAALAIPAGADAVIRHVAPGGDCLALVAAELTLPADQLAESVQKNYGWRVAKTLPVQIDHPSANAAALAQIEATFVSVLVLVPARRAPIKAIALFLEKVAAASGRNEVLLLLAGRAEGEGWAQAGDEDFAHWKNFVAIHRLRVTLERWSAA